MSDEHHPSCPKCGQTSGNDWSQCLGRCPLEISPHHDPAQSAHYGTSKPTEERATTTG